MRLSQQSEVCVCVCVMVNDPCADQHLWSAQYVCVHVLSPVCVL